MRIIETNIPDINFTNIDHSKVDLANRIIQNISPLFDELYTDKISKAKELTTELRTKKRKVLQNKDELELLLKTYKRKQKVKKLLERIEKLVSSGLLSDGHLRQETIVLLKVIDKLPDEKLDYHLKTTMNIIAKRFSRN